MNTLTVVLYVSLIAAVAASFAAAASPRLRARLLVVAGALYTGAGVLGILSVGVVFIAAGILCFALAARGRTDAAARHS